MRWVKFSERFPGSKDQASLDIDDDVIIKSDDTFLVRNWSELLNVVSLDDEWLEIIEAEPVRACESCKFYDNFEPGVGQCRKNPPVREEGGEDAVWPWVVPTDWCGEFKPK
jgi:hypothetical protein